MHYKIVKANEAGGGGLSVRDLLYKINVKKMLIKRLTVVQSKQ